MAEQQSGTAGRVGANTGIVIIRVHIAAGPRHGEDWRLNIVKNIVHCQSRRCSEERKSITGCRAEPASIHCVPPVALEGHIAAQMNEYSVTASAPTGCAVDVDTHTFHPGVTGL